MKRPKWKIMSGKRLSMLVLALATVAIAGRDAFGHPWHRHRVERPAVARPVEAALSSPFHLAAAPRARAGEAPAIAEAFAAFEKLGAIACRSDDRYFLVESNGIPAHPLMVGIRAWQQQVPLPQSYTGDNAWRIPLHPVPAARPASTKDRFLRGAIALAVNGIPIFNPLNNRGEDAFAIGELDEFGGHCGRADDYHYHIAPVHLEKIVGRGRPIAYALDGYPIYGYTEPDGGPVKNLDPLGGHEDAEGRYHYHATKAYPYLNGGFRGEVTERDGQVDPQPRAQGVREALQPLRGATIVGFETVNPATRRLAYEVGGRRGFVEYAVAADGSAAFTYTDPTGRTTRETYQPRGRGPGRGPAGDGPPRRDGPPRDGGPPPRPSSRERAADRATGSRGGLRVTSPAIRPGDSLPAEFTCDGAGVSPPVAWEGAPPETRSYAVTLWHVAPDRVKSYWVVHDIPASVRQLAKASRSVGTAGLNDRRRAEYDPMCSKGPGVKEYHLTVYALSAPPQPPPGGMTREALLAAIGQTTLAEGTLTFTYERGRRE